MNSEDARIRELAHQIWESEGKPDGQHERHWEMACKLAAADGQPVTRPRPSSRRVTKPEPLAPATPPNARSGDGADTARPVKAAAKRRARSNGGAAPAQDASTKTLANPRVGTRPESGSEIPGKKK